MPKKPSPPQSDLLRQELNALRDAVARSKDVGSADSDALPRPSSKSKPASAVKPHRAKKPP